jgi:prepilin-type N-terminal cleavage/methylation domain-containing protein
MKQKTVPNAAGRRGFSLVELLVVIAIMGVLVAMLLPSLAQSRVTAQQMICAANQRQIGVAIWAYAQDWKQYGPVDDTLVPGSGNTTGGGLWAWLLTSYLNHDPNDSNKLYNANPQTQFVMRRVKLYQCPSTWLKISIWNYNSYGPNPYAFNMESSAVAFKKMAYAYRLTSAGPARHTNDMLLVTESIAYNSIITVWNGTRLIDHVHHQKSNTLLLDGHVTAKATNLAGYPYFLTTVLSTTFSTPGTPYEVWGPSYSDPYP